MPQPLLNGTTVCFPGNALESRPVLAKHIGIIAGLWSDLEGRRAQLLSDMLKIEARLATAMYFGIESDGGKQAVLKAVVREKFPDLLDEFTKMSKSISNTAKERNNVIHGTWGLSNQNTETLIWDDLGNNILELASLSENADLIMSGRSPRPPKDVVAAPLSSLREYTEKDFINIEGRIKDRTEDIRQFGLKIWKRSRVR